MKTTRRDAFDPSQERDETGKWVSTGSGDRASEVKKAAGGGIHELKRDPNTGHTIATHSKGGRTSHMGTYSSPEKAKEAIAAHETKVRERLRSTGANSAKVHNQVTEGVEQNRKERIERLATPVAPDLQAKVAEIRAQRKEKNAEVLKYGGSPAEMRRAVRSQKIEESKARTATLKAGEAEYRARAEAAREKIAALGRTPAPTSPEVQAAREKIAATEKKIAETNRQTAKIEREVKAAEREAGRSFSPKEEERLQFVAKWGGNVGSPAEAARVEEIKKERQAAFWKGPPQAALKPGEVAARQAELARKEKVQEALENVQASFARGGKPQAPDANRQVIASARMAAEALGQRETKLAPPPRETDRQRASRLRAEGKTLAERERAATERMRASGMLGSNPVTKTYDPTKPYGNTTEERWNGGRRYTVTVQNKPLPLRYRKGR